MCCMNKEKEEASSLSAMDKTMRLTGIGRLNAIRSDMACCRMKLLHHEENTVRGKKNKGSLL